MDGAPAQSAVPEDGDDQILRISEDKDDRPKPHNFESFGAAHVNDAG